MLNQLDEVIREMSFPERLARYRREKGLTQQQLAELVGVHMIQIRRYEAGTCQPPLEVIGKISLALKVSTDMLIFGNDEQGPDKELYYHFAAIAQFDAEEKSVVKSVLEGLILKHQAKVLAALNEKAPAVNQ